jgi:hypothetical protein
VVPAHLLAPVIRRVLEVAADDEGDLRTRTTILPRTHTSKEYQTSTRARDRDFRLLPGLEDFDDRDRSLIQRGKEGLAITDLEGLFALNTKMRARNAGYARSQRKLLAEAAAAAKAPPKAKAALPKPPPRPRVPP